MSTGTTVINRTLRQLLSGTVEQRNKLSAGISASATTVVMSYDLDGIRKGQVFEIDSELFYVWEATAGTKTLTVERGFNGTTAATHSAGAIVTVNPRFPRAQILEAINDELQDLSSPMHGLFKVESYDFDYTSSNQIVNMDSVRNIIDLIGVHIRITDDQYDWIRKVKLMRDLPTDDFPSGFGLKFQERNTNGRMRVVYKAPFTPLTVETQNLVAWAGLPESCLDIVNMGVQIRLVSPREMKRSFTESQGDTRRPDEVPPGSVSNSVNNLIRMRRDRIIAEAARLARQYPTFLARD